MIQVINSTSTTTAILVSRNITILMLKRFAMLV
jgi:hypothetical protein